MLVTLLGSVMEDREEQALKADLPMLVTLLGIDMEVRLPQSQKAYLPMLVTSFSITIFLYFLSENTKEHYHIHSLAYLSQIWSMCHQQTETNLPPHELQRMRKGLRIEEVNTFSYLFIV